MCVEQIMIPFLVVTCTFSAVHVVVNVPTHSLVLVVLLMSDFMAVVSRSVTSQLPRPGSGVVRIDLLHFLAGCRRKRLNQALSVLSLSLGFF